MFNSSPFPSLDSCQKVLEILNETPQEKLQFFLENKEYFENILGSSISEVYKSHLEIQIANEQNELDDGQLGFFSNP